jgi:hypothetical protein
MVHLTLECPTPCTSEPPCSYTPGAPQGFPCGDCIRRHEAAHPLQEWGKPGSPTPWETPDTPSRWLSPELPASSGSSDGKPPLRCL